MMETGEIWRRGKFPGTGNDVSTDPVTRNPSSENAIILKPMINIGDLSPIFDFNSRKV